MNAPRRPHETGFTLVEILVALVIFAMVLLTFLQMRTKSVEDAVSTRDQRIAREIAETQLSELLAGARQYPPESGRTYTVDDYPGYEYRFLIGEASISDFESQIADEASAARPSGAGAVNDRMAWQRERDMLREARSQGVSLADYDQQLRAEEEERANRIPAEDEFEDVAVVVSFPEARLREELPPTVHFMLKAKVSTMALESLTPERAEDVARMRGGDAAGGEGGAVGAAGAAAGGGDN